MARRKRRLQSSYSATSSGNGQHFLLLAAACAAMVYFVIPNLGISALAGVRGGLWYLMWLLLAIGLGKLCASTIDNQGTAEGRLPGNKARAGQDDAGRHSGQGKNLGAEATVPPHPRNGTEDQPSSWSLPLLRSLEWKRFEDLVEAFYLAKGLRAETTSLGADGGIDLKLYERGSTAPTALVQCKAWTAKPVGVRQIREFLGVLSHEKIPKGYYLSAGTYSGDARELSLHHDLTLIDGEMFLTMIEHLPEQSRATLLAFATRGDYLTPTCPSCGIKMVKRTGGRGDFWGCLNFPKCRHILAMRQNGGVSKLPTST